MTALVQTELFEAIIELQEADEETDSGKRVELLSKAAKNIATLARSSVNLKKFQARRAGGVRCSRSGRKSAGKSPRPRV